MDRLFHITRAAGWEQANAEGIYRVSTLDRRLEDVGFIHMFFAPPVKAVADALFRGRNDLLLLEIDGAKLACPFVVEDLDGSGTAFPHAYGELSLGAVIDVRRFLPSDDGTFPPVT